METLYIIGGSGFIGKNLVRILSPFYQITVFDKFIDETFFGGYPSVKTVKMDLVEDMISTSVETPDYIINLASIVTAERDLSLFDALIASNLKILLNLFNRFKEDNKLKLFIQFGSSEEYGNAQSPYVETEREQPSSPYALVKQLTTNTAMMLHANYGFPTMVVRPGNLYGPGQNKSKFIPYVIEQLKQNQPLDVTPCEQRRDFIHVDDFAEAIHALLNNAGQCKGEIVNVSSGASISLKEIIETLKKKLHSTSMVNYGAKPYRENEMMDLRCDTSKLLRICPKLQKKIKNFKFGIE
jgi:nucleoside-diphosphate-sugar epimerase